MLPVSKLLGKAKGPLVTNVGLTRLSATASAARGTANLPLRASSQSTDTDPKTFFGLPAHVLMADPGPCEIEQELSASQRAWDPAFVRAERERVLAQLRGFHGGSCESAASPEARVGSSDEWDCEPPRCFQVEAKRDRVRDRLQEMEEGRLGSNASPPPREIAEGVGEFDEGPGDLYVYDHNLAMQGRTTKYPFLIRRERARVEEQLRRMDLEQGRDATRMAARAAATRQASTPRRLAHPARQQVRAFCGSPGRNPRKSPKMKKLTVAASNVRMLTVSPQQMTTRLVEPVNMTRLKIIRLASALEESMESEPTSMEKISKISLGPGRSTSNLGLKQLFPAENGSDKEGAANRIRELQMALDQCPSILSKGGVVMDERPWHTGVLSNDQFRPDCTTRIITKNEMEAWSDRVVTADEMANNVFVQAHSIERILGKVTCGTPRRRSGKLPRKLRYKSKNTNQADADFGYKPAAKFKPSNVTAMPTGKKDHGPKSEQNLTAKSLKERGGFTLSLGNLRAPRNYEAASPHTLEISPVL